MSTTNPPKRHRRTKENVERDLFEAAIRVIGTTGFSGLAVTTLLKEAKADPPVFYNRYKDMNDFIDKFVRNYDYWLNDTIAVDCKKGTAISNIEEIIVNLIQPLNDNVCMQKLIAWEMNEDNFITRRTGQNRDTNSEQLIRYFESEFKDCKIDFNIATAVLIGGIYYLIIHSRMGTFNKIDFSKPESIENLKETISLIIKKIFSDYNPAHPNEVTQNTNNIAIELIKNGVSLEIIERSTGLTEDAIKTLEKSIQE